MENTNAYAKVRRSRIAVIVFLLLTILSVLLSLYFHKGLVEAKKELENRNEELATSKDSIALLLKSLEVKNDSLELKKEALNVALDSINVIAKRCPADVFEEVSRVIEDAKIAAQDDRYLGVLQLEREAFKRILSNDFEVAIELLKEVEKIYPRFHNAYGIQRYLSQNRNLFSSKEGQKAIKRKIIADFSWKGPEDIVNQIKAEVNK